MEEKRHEGLFSFFFPYVTGTGLANFQRSGGKKKIWPQVQSLRLPGPLRISGCSGGASASDIFPDIKSSLQLLSE